MTTTDASPVIIDAVGLTKIFRDFWMRTKARAVDDVDLQVHAHEIFGLLGPNGSGKSTIIKMILGLLHKTSGRLSVFGKPPTDVLIKKRIGFLPEESYLYQYLNARETLDYYARLFGLDQRTRKRRIDELLEMVGLAHVAHRPLGEFSKGMARRIGLAQALINDPDLLVLDEPTSGLDPIGTHQVKTLIQDLGKRGKTILLSSHLLADVEDVCDRMVILYAGKIRAEGTAEQLLADTERTVIRTPRLTEQTISRIEQVIQDSEGKAIDAVEAPRQRLEQLFMDLVDKARQEQVETAGVVHGGATAQFLRAQDTSGDDLIESLVREQADMGQDIVELSAEREPDSPREEVLAELLTETPDGSSEREPAPARAAPEPPVDVDASMIEGLMGEPDPPGAAEQKSG